MKINAIALYIAGMKFLPAFLLSFIFYSTISFAQPVIKGRVVNVADGAPVQGSTVFISNTSKGTTADKNGYFELTGIPPGKHELVISSIGFETNVFSFDSEQLPLQLKVEMVIKVRELQNVTVEPSVEEGWDKWGKLFTDNFVGQTPNATRCKIKNEEAIHFRYFKKSNRLIAYADEPIIFENKALGYKISYQLEDFEVNFSSHSNFFSGYPLFEEMGRERKQWQRNRDKAYYGSMMHFMNCLYHNDLSKAGFEVRRMVRTPNEEKERVRKILRSIHRVNNDSIPRPSKDSIDYYNRIIGQKDYKEIYGQALLTADSIVVATDGAYKTIFFKDYLYVTYKNEIEDAEYLQFYNEKRSRAFQRSCITLLNETPVVIDVNGNFYPVQAILSMAYWGWEEKMANLLPLDFVPSAKN